mmetsp:Transcript_11315/g.42420  ORF Transcript_11315/g.42420 Transcript_11315/m.42420 type:complete len:279 (-) Transcript_11315:157-993(-)
MGRDLVFSHPNTTFISLEPSSHPRTHQMALLIRNTARGTAQKHIFSHLKTDSDCVHLKQTKSLPIEQQQRFYHSVKGEGFDYLERCFFEKHRELQSRNSEGLQEYSDDLCDFNADDWSPVESFCHLRHGDKISIQVSHDELMILQSIDSSLHNQTGTALLNSLSTSITDLTDTEYVSVQMDSTGSVLQVPIFCVHLRKDVLQRRKRKLEQQRLRALSSSSTGQQNRARALSADNVYAPLQRKTDQKSIQVVATQCVQGETHLHLDSAMDSLQFDLEMF